MYNSSVQASALLASLFYKCNRDRECIYILNYSLSKCTPGTILISLNNDIEEQTIFQKFKQTIGLSLTCRYFIIDDVIMKEPFLLLPTELVPLIVKTDKVFASCLLERFTLLLLTSSWRQQR